MQLSLFQTMNVEIKQGDALAVLRQMPECSVQCVVTSPPYYGLRDYGVEGQIGLEKTPEEYVAAMVEVFREVRRVLRDDGTFWLNIGDSYANDAKWGGATGGKHSDPLHGQTSIGRVRKYTGLKQKDIIGIPWLLAFALRADGWYLRSEIIWSKPNCMPESVTDRPTKSHEQIFLLSKSASYFYDAQAIAEPAICGDNGSSFMDERDHAVHRGIGKTRRLTVVRGGFNGKTNALPGREAFRAIKDTRNKRTVWTVATVPYKGAHFACFPPKLIEPCILAGSRVGDLVLDPFAGAGTTLLVARNLSRRSIGIELNPQYCDLMRERLGLIEKAMAVNGLYHSN